MSAPYWQATLPPPREAAGRAGGTGGAGGSRGGKAEAGNGGGESRAAIRGGGAGRGGLSESTCAVQDGDLLVEGHLAEQQFGAPVGRKSRIRPRTSHGRGCAATSASALPRGSGHSGGRLCRGREGSKDESDRNRKRRWPPIVHTLLLGENKT